MPLACVVIVDSGLKDSHGHNLAFTSALADAFRARGSDVSVLGRRSADTEVRRLPGFRPTFSCGAYDHPPGRSRFGDLLYIRSQAKRHVSELEAAVAGLGCPPRTAFLSHTLCDFELIAWRDFCRTCRQQVVLFLGPLLRPLLVNHGHRALSALRVRVSPLLQPRYWALSSLRRILRDSFFVLMDNPIQQANYSDQYGQSTLLVPIPVNPRIFRSPPGGPPPDLRGTGPRIGYFGDARVTKGFHRLPSIVAGALEKGVRARFVIQVSLPRAEHREPVVLEAARELASLSDRHPVVRLVHGPLSPTEYEALLSSVDIVLLPYEPRMYASATSGLFAESLALGKPVLVPTETLMAAELSRAGAGLVFRSGEDEDCIRCLAELVERLDEFAARGREATESWRDSHSADRWVDLVSRAAIQKPASGIQ